MTALDSLVRGLLWEWVDELDDPDAEQRAWKIDYVEGMLAATEAVGLLDADELAAFRRISLGDHTPPSRGDHGAAEAHLESLRTQLQPMRRDPDRDGLEASHRFHGALEALAAAGLLPDEVGARWHGRALAAEAPWLDDPDAVTSHGGTAYAIAIPPETPDEAAEDARAMEEVERRARSGEICDVMVLRQPDRYEGLAVTAIVTRTESVDVHFHHVGPPQGESGTGFADLEAFRTTVDTLTPPTLTDDIGTRYEPATPRPISSTGTGGIPDQERPQVIKGHWRYFPAPPANASAFRADRGKARWSLGRITET